MNNPSPRSANEGLNRAERTHDQVSSGTPPLLERSYNELITSSPRPSMRLMIPAAMNGWATLVGTNVTIPKLKKAVVNPALHSRARAKAPTRSTFLRDILATIGIAMVLMAIINPVRPATINGLLSVGSGRETRVVSTNGKLL